MSKSPVFTIRYTTYKMGETEMGGGGNFRRLLGERMKVGGGGPLRSDIAGVVSGIIMQSLCSQALLLQRRQSINWINTLLFQYVRYRKYSMEVYPDHFKEQKSLMFKTYDNNNLFLIC